jgi:hypothetical protein
MGGLGGFLLLLQGWCWLLGLLQAGAGAGAVAGAAGPGL